MWLISDKDEQHDEKCDEFISRTSLNHLHIELQLLLQATAKGMDKGLSNLSQYKSETGVIMQLDLSKSYCQIKHF